MTSLINQEIYKIRHKKFNQVSPIILFPVMLALGLATGSQSDNRFYIESGYAGFQWITIILIVQSASIISMEFQYGTIKHLVCEANSRIAIYLSKLLVVLLYDIILHLFVLIVSIVIKYITVGNRISFSQDYLYSASLFHNLLSNTFVDFLGSFIIVSAVFMVASLINSSGVAIALGLGIMFIGEGLSSALIRTLITRTTLIKWNPFNMLNIANQWANPDYSSVTHLTLTQLIWGNMLYTVLFVAISFIVFKKKKI